MNCLLRTVLLSLCLVIPHSALGRTWTSSEGEPLEAEFVSASETSVRLKRDSDGKIFELPLERLSVPDQEFIKAKAEEMNKPQPVAAGSYADLITGDWAAGTFQDQLPYRLYASTELDGKQQYPLLIWLHGSGGRGSSNDKHFGALRVFAAEENYSKHPAFLLAPQCPSEKTWWDDTADVTLALIDDLMANLPIDPNRVYITGHSLGGAGTCYLAQMRPDLFAAAVPLASSWRIPEKLKDPGLHKTSFWAFVGENDKPEWVEGVELLAKALDENKIPVKLTIYPGMGHSIVTETYEQEELRNWIFDQSRNGG